MPQALAQEFAREDVGGIRFAVTRVGPSDGVASVRYATCPTSLADAAAQAACAMLSGTATVSIDYTETHGRITFADAATSTSITVPVADDSIDEPDETLHFVLFEGTGLEVPPEHAVTEGTIIDDDPSPVLSASNPSAAEDVGDLTFEVNLDRASSRQLEVPWKTVDQTAVAGEDYTSTSGTITFAPGSTSATVTVAVTDDEDIEPPETFKLEFTSVDHLNIGRGGVGTIEDNEVNEGEPYLVVKGEDAAETNASISFTLALTHTSGAEIVVEYETVDGTAKSSGSGVADRDYVATTGSVTFAPGEISHTVSVSLRDDNVWEGDETLGLDITSAVGTEGVVDGDATILDDEGRPTANSPATCRGITRFLCVGEDVGNAVIPVELSHRSAKEFVITGTTEAFTACSTVSHCSGAVQQDDYTHTVETMTFAPGVTSGQSMRVPIVDDDLYEPPPSGANGERFKVYFHEQGSAVSSGSLFWVEIRDNEGPPTVDIKDASNAEGRTISFTLDLSHSSNVETTVDWETRNGTARAGFDYEARSGKARIGANRTSFTLSVDTLLDDVDEANEFFWVDLSQPNGLLIGDANGRGTIIDDDPPPECHVLEVSGEGGVRPCDDCEESAGSAVESDGPINFTVAIVAESETTRDVRYATADHTAEGGSDYQTTNGTLTFAAGELEKTVAVPLIDDSLVEEVEQFRFTLPDCLPEDLDTDVYATIFDDDVIGVSVAIADAEGDEDVGELDFVVTLSESPTQEATVAYRTRDGTAVAGEDYTAVDDVLTFAAGSGTEHTISVAVTDDGDVDAPRETFEVVLSDPANVVFAPGRRTTAVGTIVDNEMTPVINVGAAQGTEGGTLAFPVTLSAASTAEITVEYRLEDGTARFIHDYLGNAGDLTLARGTTSGTIRVGSVDNDLSEPDETFTIEIHTPVNATLGDAKATGTIVDDEVPPVIERETAISIAEARSRRLQVSFETGSTLSEYPVKIQARTAHGTAGAADYHTFDRELLIKAEEAATDPFDVRTKGDAVDEDDETFDIHFTVVEGHVAAPAQWTTRVTVTDDDQPPHVGIRDARADEGTSAAFEVRLSAASERRVSLRYQSRYGTATADDFDAVDAMLEFAPGQTSRTIEVPLLEDMLDEPDEETFKVGLSDVVNAVFGRPSGNQSWFEDYGWDGEGNGLVVDTDPSPQVSITDQEANEGDADPTMNFEVTMDVAHYQAIRVNYEITEDTATEGDDYASSHYSGQLTFSPGTSRRTIAVSAVDDDEPEGIETFEIELDHPRQVVIGEEPPYVFAKRVAVGTILDDDVHVTVDGARGKEGETVSFVVAVSGDFASALTVDYELRSGTATLGADFQAKSGSNTGSVDFGVGETSKSIDVDLLADALDEEDEETFELVLTSARGARITTGQAEGVIEDVDDLPTLTIADATAVEEGETLGFVVTLSPASGRRVTVGYRTQDGTAVAGEDYVPDQAVLAFEAAQTSSTIAVASIDDDKDELDEDFHVVLGAAQNATVDATDGAGTIRDNDGPPALSITGGRGVEGGEVEFSVSRSAASSQTITVRYATKDGTATGLDYAATSGVLTFEPDGEAVMALPVALLADDLDEPDETFEMELSDPTGATLAPADAAAEGVIEDGNDPPLLTVADARGVEGETLSFVASLVGGSSRTVTVRYAADEAEGAELAGSPAAGSGVDFEPDTGVISFAPGESAATFAVTTLDDTVHEIDEVFAVRFSDPSGMDLAAEFARGTIEDNEVPPSLSITDAPDAPEDGMLVFDVALDGVSAQVVTVGYRVVDGTAVAGMDYEATEGVLEIQPGESSATVEVALVDDDVDEPDEHLGVVLGDAQFATVDVAEAAGTILDNDDPPVFSITGGTGVEGSDIGFAVTLTGVSSQAVTVGYATSDGTAVAGADYALAAGLLKFEPGEGSVRTVPVGLLSDNADEDDETFVMTLSAPVGATLGVDTAAGTIIDVNEPPLLSVDDARGPEGGELAFQFSLSGTSGRAVTVDYEFLDATARAGEDYEATAGRLTIEPGESGIALPVSLLEDDIDEPDELFVLLLSSPVNASLADPVALGTIEDNDDPPMVSVADAPAVGEGGTLAFTVSLTAVSGHDVEVTYRTVDGSAVAGVDYAANRGVLTLSAGTRQGTVEVAALDDSLDEPHEDLTVRLTRPRNAILARDVGGGVILDDDDPPELHVADAVGVEGTEIVFLFTLLEPSAQRVEVAYATADGTARAGSDYVAANGTLELAPFERAATVTLAVPDDTIEEQDETFTLSLSSPVNATLTRDAATGTITDDDGAPVLSVSGGSGEEGSTLEFEIARRGSTSRTATVDYATVDGTAVAGADYGAVAGTLRFAAGQESATVPVRLLDDAVDEPEETFELTLSNAVDANIAVGTAVGTIVDTDAAPRLSVTGGEDVEGGTVEFVVSLAPSSTRSVTVIYETTDGSAEAGADYDFTSGSLTFAPGETARTVAVALLDDALDEADETFALDLSSPANATVATPSADGTILDDDASPALSVTGDRDVEGGSVDFVVTLEPNSARTVTVGYATADGTAVENDDYRPVDGTLTFAAGQTRKTVVVQLVDDDVDEPDEAFALALSSPANATLAVDSADGEIIDDDGAALLTVADAVATEGDGTIEFTVSLNKPSGRAVTARFDTADGTAVDGEDYESASGMVTIAAGGLATTVSIALRDDSADEPDETFTLTLSAVDNAVAARDVAEGTILDDDRSATLSVGGARGPEGGTANFVITKSGTTTRSATVQYRTVDGTASVHADYAFAGGTLTFAPDDTSLTVAVALTADAVHEPDETFRLNLSSAEGAVLGVDSGVGVILDRSEAPEISIGDTRVVEGGTAVFDVTVAGARSGVVTADFTTVDGEAVAGEDYETTSGQLTFAPEDRRLEIAVVVLDDTLDEPDETFSAVLSSPQGAVLADAEGTATVIDDDGSPVLRVAATEGVEGETLEFVVSLSGSSGQRVTVDYATSDGTAIAPGDYQAASGILEFAPGTLARTIAVPSVDDELDESTESLTVTLSASSGANIAIGSAEGLILDNDATTLSIADVGGFEGDPLEFVVTLVGSTSLPVSVRYATSDGTATVGTDYVFASGTLTLDAGATTQTVTVATLQDDLEEPDETLAVNLSAPVNATLAEGRESATGSIWDDDGLPILTVADTSVGESDGEAGFRLSLDRSAPRDLTVAYRTEDATAVAGTDYARTAGSATFSRGDTAQTVFVPVVDDDLDEPDESFDLLLSDGAGLVVADDTATAEIVDDDEPPTVTVSDATAVESEGELRFAVTLSGASGREVAVAYSTEDGTAVVGEDYAMAAGELTFVPGVIAAEVSVPVIDDAIVEPDEEHLALVWRVAHQGVADGEARSRGTIVDDDLAPPSAHEPLPNVHLCVGGAPRELALGTYFGGDELTFAAVASDPDVAAVDMIDGSLTVHPVSEGEATVSVTAINDKGEASGTFHVLVVSDPAELAAIEGALGLIGGGHLGEVVSAVADRFGPARDRLAAAAGPVDGDPQALPPPASGREALLGERRPPVVSNALTWGNWPTPAGLRLQPHRPPRDGILAFSLTDSAAGGTSWSIWGRGGVRRFQGGEDARVRGTLDAAQIGVDGRFGDWVAGLSLAHSRGEADYRFARSLDACGRAGDGEGLLETEIASISPYAGAILERGWIWATIGFGRGSATLERCDSGRRDVADLDMRLFALGGRQELGGNVPWSLSLLEEVGVAEVETEAGISAVAGRMASAGRARIGLEAGHLRSRASASVVTYLRANARGDWGDGGSGAGLELEAGVRYRCDDRRLGYTVALRSLATHSASGYRDYGAEASASLLPRPDGTGLALTMKSSLGDDAGLAYGWSRGLRALEMRPDAKGQTMPWRLEATVGYGAKAFGGLTRPFAAWGAGELGGDARVGVRYEFANHLERVAAELGVGRGLHGTQIGISCRASF